MSIDPAVLQQAINAACGGDSQCTQALTGIATIESSFGKHTVGSKITNKNSQYYGEAAQGAFQIMPGNAKAAGIDPNDPYQAALWTAQNWRNNMKALGDFDASVAAHHVGLGNARKLMRKGGVNKNTLKTLKWADADYLDKFNAAVGRQPEQPPSAKSLVVARPTKAPDWYKPAPADVPYSPQELAAVNQQRDASFNKAAAPLISAPATPAPSPLASMPDVAAALTQSYEQADKLSDGSRGLGLARNMPMIRAKALVPELPGYSAPPAQYVPETPAPQVPELSIQSSPREMLTGTIAIPDIRVDEEPGRTASIWKRIRALL
jgi:hypothetical protein